MSLSNVALYATVLLYLITAVGYYWKKNYGLTLTFVCYALANIGIIMAGGE